MRRGGAGKRRDKSEPAIIEALEKIGAFVQQCNGAGVPDLLVCYRGQWTPIECKTGKGKRRPGQEPYPVARTPEEAIGILMRMQ